MTKKVLLAVFDKDLKARDYGKYPVTKDGKKISVRSGGERNFNPSFDNDSFIEFPYRALSSPWKISWRRVYFAPNGAKACVNFKSGDIPLPDMEQLKRSIGSTLLDRLGQDKPPFPAWIVYVMFLLNILILGIVSGVINI